MGSPRKAKTVGRALESKGMAREEKHHHMFRKELGGVTTLVARISHGSDEIGDGLGKLMANQCCLSLKEFWQLVDCTLGEQEWDALVSERCGDGKNPYLGY